jgi:hypothetical protein
MMGLYPMMPHRAVVCFVVVIVLLWWSTKNGRSAVGVAAAVFVDVVNQ